MSGLLKIYIKTVTRHKVIKRSCWDHIPRHKLDIVSCVEASLVRFSLSKTYSLDVSRKKECMSTRHRLSGGSSCSGWIHWSHRSVFLNKLHVSLCWAFICQVTDSPLLSSTCPVFLSLLQASNVLNTKSKVQREGRERGWWKLGSG